MGGGNLFPQAHGPLGQEADGFLRRVHTGGDRQGGIPQEGGLPGGGHRAGHVGQQPQVPAVIDAADDQVHRLLGQGAQPQARAVRRGALHLPGCRRALHRGGTGAQRAVNGKGVGLGTLGQGWGADRYPVPPGRRRPAQQCQQRAVKTVVIGKQQMHRRSFPVTLHPRPSCPESPRSRW